MTHTYSVTGMTCTGCQAKVTTLLSQVPGVQDVLIDLPGGKAKIESDKLISTEDLRSALKAHPKYQLTELPSAMTEYHHRAAPNPDQPAAKSWFTTYKPILLIFGYILVISLVAARTASGTPSGPATSAASASFDPALAMRVFMAGFFLTFSFFKMLDLKGFAESYSMYDIIAKQIKSWGYIYAFIELILGISYALNVQPILTNVVTLLVMIVSIAGVLQSVLNKRKIQCACLGAIFNLPMSTVTIIEDTSMIVMSTLFLAHFIHF
jgi:copper chaperone CopZ